MPEFVLEGRDHAAHAESEFVLGYIEAMFFTESAYGVDAAEWFDDETQADLSAGRLDGCLPSDMGYEEIHPTALQSIRDECARFQFECRDLLARAYSRPGYGQAQAGRDFWFTRNGHGVGFWDRKELKADRIGRDLSEHCGHGTNFPESHVWFGDHVENGNAPFVYHE